MEPLDVKAQSEAVIRELGGTVNEALPWLERTEPRSCDVAADRSLVLHAMLQIHFGAPVTYIDGWIVENELTPAVSNRERRILSTAGQVLNEQDRTDLYWYIEALWAMAWAGALVAGLAVNEPVGEQLASLLPDLQKNETADSFRRSYRLRPYNEVYRMLDLYYRAHWYARDGQLRGYSTEPFALDSIMERRKALEWLANRQIHDWDDAPDST